MNSPTNIPQLLSAHPFLEGLSQSHLDKLALLACEVRFQPDQTIFRESDPSSFFYLILEGKVALEITAPGRVIRIQTIGEGEELGWSSVLSRVNKQFQARSLTQVRAIAFDGARLSAAFEEDCGFGFMMLRKILGVVAERLRNTRLQMLDIYSKRGATNL